MVEGTTGHHAGVKRWSTLLGDFNHCVFFCAGLTFSVMACSASGDAGSTTTPPATGPTAAVGGNNGTGGSGTSALAGTSGIVLVAVGGQQSSSSGGAGGKPSDQVIRTLPAGFTPTEKGGYKLGARIDGAAGSGSGGMGGSAGAGGGSGSGECGNILLGVVRDFKGAGQPGGHADFEADGVSGGNATPGMVSMTLGADQKPIYSSMCEIGHPAAAPTCPYGAQNTSAALFESWYHDTPNVNQAYEVSIFLAPQPGGLFTFQSLTYFPIDGGGFGADGNMQHNFGFTTELHTTFLYKGTETFTFEGDDDVWVYINNKLAVDLGGLHPMQARPINLATAAAQLGIEVGKIYPLDLFHAERHTSESTFRIDTNLSFVDCGRVIPSKVK